MTHLRLGTRRSSLALAQSGQVARQIEAASPGTTVELVPFVTEGDRRPGDLKTLGGKGLFTQELEAALLDGRLDLAVHSLKDLPVDGPEELVVGAFPRRADPRDVLVSEVGRDLDGLPAGAVLLTGSLRRRSQILAHRPDLRVESLRGNVETRLTKWRSSGEAGVILAAAGIERLGIDDVPAHPLDPAIVIPAPGQGILAVQIRRDNRAAAAVAAVDDPVARRSAEIERRVVRAFGGDCTLPLAAWARPQNGSLALDAFLGLEDGHKVARASVVGDDHRKVADQCVKALVDEGAREILRALRAETTAS